QDVSGSIAIPSTGGWQNWQTVTAPVTLSHGRKVIRFEFERGDFNANYFELVATAGNQPPVASLQFPANNATFGAGQPVEIVAQASDPDGGIAKIEFLANGSKIGETASSPFRFVWQNPPAGTHTLTARATDIEGIATD